MAKKTRHNVSWTKVALPPLILCFHTVFSVGTSEQTYLCGFYESSHSIKQQAILNIEALICIKDQLWNPTPEVLDAEIFPPLPNIVASSVYRHLLEI